MKKELFDYNDSDINSIIDYSQLLLNRKFSQIIDDYQQDTLPRLMKTIKLKPPLKYLKVKSVQESKGKYGNYIEQ